MWDKIRPFIPPVRWLLLLVLLSALFAASRAPASWAAYFMTRDTTLGLSGVAGTVWQGGARMTSVEIDNRHYSLGALNWRLDLASLLSLTPCVDVQTRMEGQSIKGRACVGAGGRLEVTEGQIDAPAQLVEAGLPFEVRGRLSAIIESLTMDDGRLSGLEGNLTWTGARVQTEDRWVSLGDYAAEARFDAENRALVADVFDLEGPVSLDVETRLPLAGGVFIEGELALEESFSDEIQARDWLPMVLEHREGGRYRVDLQF